MWQKELAEALTKAEPRERKDVISAYMAKTGFSRQHLYRVAREHGFKTGRKRADKGRLRSGLTDAQVEFISSLMYVTGRENKGPIMPVERAIQIAEDNGIVEPGQASPGTVNRILRERQMSKRHLKAPDPHVELRSLHPNHVHVFDVSVCIQYYLKDGRLGFMDERDFYKNKPHNFAKVKTRLLRYVVVDHFSGAFYVKYYDTTGETQANLYDFLKEAWGTREDEHLPFRGVPFILLMDAGSANTSRAIVAMLERMEVNIPRGKPYNPQRQGAVETSHTIIEEWFESGLRVQPATSVEELNEWARDLIAWHQLNKEHTRHKMPRTLCWLRIKPEQLRELPPEDILKDLYANPEEERTVDGAYCISYRGNQYQLKHVKGLYRGAKVQAVLKPWKWPEIEVAYRGEVYEAKPVEVLPAELGGFKADAAVIGRDYASQPETIAQQTRKRAENTAYGEDRKADSVPFEGLKVFGHHSAKAENLSVMEKRGTPLEVDRKVSERRVSIGEMLKRIVQRVGPIPPELNRELRDRFGDSVPAGEAEEVIRKLEERSGESEQAVM